jgi:rusticyanin
MQIRNPMRDRKAFGILLIIVVLLLVPIGYYLDTLVNNPNTQGGAGCIGELLTDSCNLVNANEEGPEYNGTSQLNLLTANYTAMNGTLPSYVQSIQQNDTLVFHSMNITIIAFGNANSWVSAVTNTPVPAYDNVTQYSNGFAIYHLYAPTLVIPRGATVNVTFVNMDYGDHHNFVMSTFPPPFPMYIMQNMCSGGEMVAMTPLLPPVDNTSDSALAIANASVFSYTVHLALPKNVTHMWYMCMMPGHAMQGMWGNITIVDPTSVGA